MRYFLQLTRSIDGVVFLGNLDHIQRIYPDSSGSFILWSNNDEPTNIKETYEEIHIRIKNLLGVEK